jgi:hypothetical protein
MTEIGAISDCFSHSFNPVRFVLGRSVCWKIKPQVKQNQGNKMVKLVLSSRE